ncbi:hypothetical protein MC885_000906, partial [Smutsia gigantea]
GARRRAARTPGRGGTALGTSSPRGSSRAPAPQCARAASRAPPPSRDLQRARRQRPAAGSVDAPSRDRTRRPEESSWRNQGCTGPGLKPECLASVAGCFVWCLGPPRLLSVEARPGLDAV